VTHALGVALLLVAAAGLAHYAIARAARRIPRWLARRRGLALGPDVPGARAALLAAVAAQIALWLGVTARLAMLFPPAQHALAAARAMIASGLMTPLATVGERSYSALDLLMLPLAVLAVWLVVSALVWLARRFVLAAAGLEEGAQEMFSGILRYALVLPALVIVLTAWGVDLRSLAILASVLGVGIGFGLQNIANNLVSGLLINFGRTLRPGDFVNVGSHAGTVMRVGARSTQVRTLDQVTVIVPNSELLESEVVNWSHGDPTSRVHVRVGVAYGTEPALVRRALFEAAAQHPGVLREPRPEVRLSGFGESSLDFELLVWTRDPRDQDRLRSDLNFRIAEQFARAGISIPFPQQDVHLRSASLERAIETWQRSLPAAAQLPETEAELAQRAGSAALEAPGGWRGGRLDEWSEAELDALLSRMRGEGGIAVGEHRYLFRVYRDCFVGRSAVDWLVAREGLSRTEAVAVGQRLVERGSLHHVLDEHGFRDGHFFYRFESAPAQASSSAPPRA
jgi:small-conductance mechanosensitive channel